MIPVVLSSCASTEPTRPKPAPKPLPTVKVTPLQEADAPAEEEVEASKSDLISAAQWWLDQARYTLPPERQDFLLRSAAALLESGLVDESKQVLDATDIRGLPTGYLLRKRMLRAQIAFARGQTNLALRYLGRFGTMQGLEPAFKSRVLSLRAQANIAAGQHMRGLRDLVLRETVLTDPDEIKRNRERIWSQLGEMNAITLQIERQSVDNWTPLADWLDLALIFVDFGADPYRLRITLSEWAKINPSGGAQLFAKDLFSMSGPPITRLSGPVNKVALLLPLASKFGQAAQSVHDGFMASWELDGSPNKPEVVIYDVGEVPDLAVNYYRVAVGEGADLVVGPLGKQAVAAIINSRAIQIPTLLLGGLQSKQLLPPKAFQIDLAPEREAVQVATRAFLDGHRVAGVLRPDSPWGERVAQAFIERWKFLGGVIADTQVYKEASTDHSFAIQQILNLDSSEGRKSALSVALGATLDFQPRRRQDLDLLFLVARPVAGRLIKPQINFFQAHDIPVYSTSHIYTGVRDSVNDADLNQVIFGDMPWLLRKDNRSKLLHDTVNEQRPSKGDLDRLFALGMDAYLLSRVIPYFDLNAAMKLKGFTAERLNIGNDRRIERQLTWAQFEQGEPHVLEPKEAMDGFESIQPDQIESLTPFEASTGTSTGARTAGGVSGTSLPQ